MNFAIIKDDKIINVILADSKEIAEEVTGLEALETSGEPWIDWTRSGDTWIKPEIIDVEEVTPTPALEG
jgi:hypothetical protein